MLHGKFMDAYDGSTENPLLEILESVQVMQTAEQEVPEVHRH